MAKIRYRAHRFQTESIERIAKMNTILAEYKARVSVRQLYYRLVACGAIPNVPREYNRVQSLVTDARYAGLIDWDAIEDRNREPLKTKDWRSGRAGLDELVQQFRMDRWSGQPFYVELWVEKAALSGVLWPIAADYHITLMVNRGYSSASAMKESAERIQHHIRSSSVNPHGRRPTILYLGDHDPSGEDMVRDIRTRLLEFGCPGYLDVRKVALTSEQIKEHKPPPNPVKLNDSRAQDYIAKHGVHSWEVDALPPNVLDLLVRTAINAYVDKLLMKAAIVRENVVKAKIKDFAASFREPT